MLLASMSTDVLCSIFELLRYDSIRNLLSTGSLRIINAVMQVRSISCIKSGTAPLALPSLHRFTHLLEFSAGYESFQDSCFASLTKFSLQSLPPSLTRLQLAFANAPSFLQENPSQPASKWLNFKDIFPNLLELDVSGVWHRIDQDFFDSLPSSILRLRIPTSVFARPTLVGLSRLPPCLEILDLSDVTLDDFTDTGIWPPNLAELSLVTNYRIAELQSSLPPQLKRFEIKRDEFIDPEEVPIASWASLPQELEHFQGIADSIDSESIKRLPRSLLSLRVTYMQNVLSYEMLEHLPPNLTRLDVATTSHEEIDRAHFLRRLPRSLRSASHWETLRKPIDRPLLEAYPPKFERLMLPKDVNIDEVADALPKTLTELSCHLTDATARHLPRTLRHLTFETGQLTKEGVSCLPSTLQTLRAWSNGFADDAAVAALPKGLTRLNWGIRPLILSVANSVPMNPSDHTTEVLGCLPKNLTTLTLSIDATLFTNDHVSPLRIFSELTTLRMGGNVLTALTSNHLLCLPPSLTILETMVRGIVHEDHLLSLPNSLIRLSISATSTEDMCGMGNMGVKRLSRNLIYLTLPACPYLTSWCLPDLPPRLKYFKLNFETPEWFPPYSWT